MARNTYADSVVADVSLLDELEGELVSRSELQSEREAVLPIDVVVDVG